MVKKDVTATALRGRRKDIAVCGGEGTYVTPVSSIQRRFVGLGGRDMAMASLGSR